MAKLPTFTPHPYPFRIPQVPKIDEQTLCSLPPHAVLEFLRIEMLLRSKVVQNYYRAGKRKSELSLKERFGMGWNCFKGGHHHLLNPSSKTYTIRLIKQPAHQVTIPTGVDDLGAHIRLQQPKADLGEWIRLSAQDSHALLLRLDAHFPTRDILKDVEQRLNRTTVLARDRH